MAAERAGVSSDLESSPIGFAPEEPASGKVRGCLRIGLIVLTIFVAGGMVLVPKFLRGPADGRLTACKFNCKNLGTALEIYATDNHGHYPKSLERLVSSKILKEIPRCAAAGQDTYSGTYRVSQDPDRFHFYCAGTQHESASRGAFNFPQYDSQKGLLEGP